MNQTRFRLTVPAYLLFCLTVGCSAADPPVEPPPTPDAGTPERCMPPAPRLGGTAETRELAAAAAHCGVPAFSWLSSTELGKVVGKGVHDHFTADSLGVLLALSHVTPSGPLHEVDLDQIAYLTQDRGKPIEASALVAYPADLATRSSVDVLLVLHGTAGFTDSCAPSGTTDARPLVAALASLGYVVVVPQAPLCCGRPLYDWGLLDAAKRLWRRDRPGHDAVPLWRRIHRYPKSNSFPSGHSASATSR